MFSYCLLLINHREKENNKLTTCHFLRGLIILYNVNYVFDVMAIIIYPEGLLCTKVFPTYMHPMIYITYKAATMSLSYFLFQFCLV